MNLLLIGGTGVLSSAVAREAIKQGIDVTSINRGLRNPIEGARVIVSDKGDKKKIAAALGGKTFDAIIDFLCITEEEVKQSFHFYSNYTKQYIYISSCAVYNTQIANPCHEDSPKDLPIWSYSGHKWHSEELLVDMARKAGINYTVIRPCVTYGDTRIPYGVAPQYGYHWTFFARIYTGKPLIKWNGGTTRCNMTRVEDFAVGVVGLVGNQKAYNEAYNICGDETPSFNDVLKEMELLANKPVIAIDMSSRFYASQIPGEDGEIEGGRSIDAINSNEKIKSIVPSFIQKYNLHEGMKMTYKAYIDQNYQRGIDWAFDGECDRIIKKWCKQNNMSVKSYHLGFKDYLGNASLHDKVQYYCSYHYGRIDTRLLKLFMRIMNKISHLIKK